MTSDQLVLSHHSLRFASFPDRVRAAAEGGYSGIGLYLRAYERLRADGHSDAELRDTLAEHGQQVLEIEALRGWASTGAGHEQYQRDLDLVDNMVAAFGPARHVQVIGPYEGGVDEAAAGFARVCDWLADRGMSAAIEFLPEMSNIPDIASAWQIIEAAGRANGGICVDSWHHFRGGSTFELLASVPPERIVDIQINDGPNERTEPDYYTDCTSNRLVPGAGDFDLVGFVRTLDDMGVDAPFSVEVISHGLDQLPPGELARAIADGTRAVLNAARGDAQRAT